MLHLKKAVLTNWKCFRGEHTIDFTPDVYAVVARFEEDDERSNWGGKSSLLVAIGRFLLFGDHDEGHEDNWITDDASEASVEGTLSDGAVIKRWRKRGKSTQLEFTRDGVKQTKDEAQKSIVEHIGLGKEDFNATCSIAQKELSRFVTQLPSRRMETVSAWLNLDPLQRCESNIAQRMSEIVSKHSAKLTSLAALQEQIETNEKRLKEEFGLKDVDPREYVAECQKRLEEAEEVIAEGDAELHSIGEWKAAAARAAEYDEVVERGQRLRVEVDKDDIAKLEKKVEQSREDLMSSRTDHESTAEELERAKTLAAGKFDGMCPVVGGQCPASDFVRNEFKGRDDIIEGLETAFTESSAAMNQVRAAMVTTEQQLTAARDRASRLRHLKDQAKALYPASALIKKKGAPPNAEAQEKRGSELRAKYNALSVQVKMIQQTLKDIEQAKAKQEEIREGLADIEEQLAIHREAAVVFGRNGAQRRASEEALAEIESDANEALSEEGIDLQMSIQWGREASKGLATACQACGNPFPKSQKEKTCQRCGAERGPKIVERLDLELSDRSGAADDLVGFVFTLSAAAWLRRERECAWSCVMIDEPFGSLDAANKRSVAGNVASMLRQRFGFSQAFIIAHEQAVMDAMPAKVQIVASKQGSRIA